MKRKARDVINNNNDDDDNNVNSRQVQIFLSFFED